MRVVGVVIAVIIAALPGSAVAATSSDVKSQDPMTVSSQPPTTAADAPTGYVSVPDLRPIYRVRTKDPVVFITIDDGVHKSVAARNLVERRNVPITSFLTSWTVKDRARYFERVSAKGSIQNHSATHASFALAATDLDHEICYSQRKLGSDFDSQPWMIRPPYGAGANSPRLRAVARRCGISHIVMWDTVIEDAQVQYRYGKLRKGSIILLHFGPNLDEDLRTALRITKKAGLRPANLAEYLPRLR